MSCIEPNALRLPENTASLSKAKTIQTLNISFSTLAPTNQHTLFFFLAFSKATLWSGPTSSESKAFFSHLYFFYLTKHTSDLPLLNTYFTRFCSQQLPKMLPLPLPPQKQTMSTTPLNQIVISKPALNQQTRSKLESPYFFSRKQSKPPILKQPRPTNPIIWCGAILCLIFSLILIFFGIVTLIIFLVIRPRNPLFDIPSASLSAIYFDSPEYFNGDFTFLANFTNPNHKIEARFKYLDIELYFSDRLIATQAPQPFIQRRRETRLQSVHMISSLVYLPQNLAVELQKQVLSNRIQYNIQGRFRVSIKLGLIHLSYRLHARCQLVMTGPPTGILIARSCRTKR